MNNTQIAPIALTISDISVRQDDQGRYCLTDLHKSSGGLSKHQPSNWLATKQTQELIAEVEKDIPGIPGIKKSAGRSGSTYVVKELVYAYAMWISAKFHLQVIRAYDALQSQPVSNPDKLTYEVDFLQREHIRLSNELAQCLSVDLSAHDKLDRISLKFKSTGYSHGRWIVTLSDGEFIIKAMQQGEFVTTSEKLADKIGDSMGGAVKREHLLDIIKAAVDRIQRSQLIKG